MTPLKTLAAFGVCAALALSFGAPDGHAFLEKFKKKGKTEAAQKAPVQPVQSESDLRREHEELKKQYEALDADRQNILEQTKHLFSVKSELSQTREAQDRIKNLLVSLTKRNRRLHGVSRKHAQETRSLVKYNDQVEAAYGEILPKYDQLMNENAQLSVALLEKVDQSPEYQRMAKEAEALRRVVQVKEDEARKRAKEISDLTKKTAVLENTEDKLITELEAKSGTVTNLRAERESLLEINADLAQQVEELPKKFEDMAKQNNLLLRETADMHYNMGVFFTQNRNYTRALSEFERALEFNPENAKVHYNLGYLYADQLKEHDRAMYHFRRYITIEPQSEKAESVRDYLLVRKTMGDKPYVEKMPKLQRAD